MKKIRNVIIWSITSLLIQSVVFFGLDKYYESSLLNTKVTEEIVPNKIIPIKAVTINIPTNATKIEASYNGKYISYYDNDKLTVVNTLDGTSKEVSPEADSTQVFTKWFPDSDTMIIFEKTTVKSSTINLFRYNADNNSKFIPTDTNNKEIKPKLSGGNDNISDIALCPSMNNYYIKVKKSTTRFDILNIDVNGNVSTTLSSRNIGKIDMVNNLPNLIYEDLSTGSIKVNKKNFIYSKKSCILGTADDDNLYLGVLQNEKVTKIVYGKVSEVLDQWKTIALDSPVDKKEITLTTDGKLYVNTPLEGTLTEKTTGKKTAYKGTLLAITTKEVLSLDNGKLERANLG